MKNHLNFLENLLIVTEEEFAREIENLRDMYNFNYIDAILWWTEKHDYEIERIGHFIKKSSPLTMKLYQEGLDLHLFDKSKIKPVGNTLPL